MKKIAVYSEIKDGILDKTAYELISKADKMRNLAKNNKNIDIEITNIAISNSIDEESVKKAYSAGADNFVLIKNEEFATFNQIKYSRALLSYFCENPHDYILFPATLTGRMIAPRVTTALNTGLVADCTGLDFVIQNDELKLASTRPTFGAELMATILSKKSPQCATIRPKTFPATFNCNCEGHYIEYPCSINDEFDLNILEKTGINSKKHNYDNSKVIFCAGFGLYDGKDNEYVTKLFDISQKLNVDFALSRKLVDYKVFDSGYQIGQTGFSATPNLYVGFGVSGAIQHIQGMKNSKKIVAINTDKNAEIFKYCDYKIVADAKKIIDDIYGFIFK